MKGYLANGLFSLADRNVNELIAKKLRDEVEGLDLFVPQEQGINDKNSYADSMMIAELDTKNLLESDVLIAVLDGVEIDSGVASEIGAFYTTGKKIIGLYTDVRQQGRDNVKKIDALIEDGTENQFMYRNLYTLGLVKLHGVVVDNLEDLVKEVKLLNNLKMEWS